MVTVTCEELNSVWTLKKALEREQRRLKDLQLIAAPVSPQADGLPHVRSASSKVERLATMIADCGQLIDSLTEKIANRKVDLLIRLQSLNLAELQERVLCYHYVACKTFKETSRLMSFTNDYVCYLHRRGLEAVGLTSAEIKRYKKTHKPALISA